MQGTERALVGIKYPINVGGREYRVQGMMGDLEHSNLLPAIQPLALEATQLSERQSIGLTHPHSLRQCPATHSDSWSPKL